ncbi:MAG: rhodanese-like domain-containing protein [Cyanobacteria bacterium P01_E01_bin.34]
MNRTTVILGNAVALFLTLAGVYTVRAVQTHRYFGIESAEFRRTDISSMQGLPSISVTEMQTLLEASADGEIQLIDVREPRELAIANLNHLGFQNYPLGSYEQWESNIVNELEPGLPTYVLCHHGIRSAQMTAWLLNQGFTDVTNISGGIDAWSNQVDATIPQY